MQITETHSRRGYDVKYSSSPPAAASNAVDPGISDSADRLFGRIWPKHKSVQYLMLKFAVVVLINNVHRFGRPRQQNVMIRPRPP